MARRSSISSTLDLLAKAQSQAEKQRKRELASQTKAAKAAEKARKEIEKGRLLDAKERAKLHVEARQAETDLKNEELEQALSKLGSLLIDSLDEKPIDLEALKPKKPNPVFSPGNLATQENAPVFATYAPSPLTGAQKLNPLARKKFERDNEAAKKKFEENTKTFILREQERMSRLTEARKRWEQQVAEQQRKYQEETGRIDELKSGVKVGIPSVVVDFSTFVLEASVYPDGFPQHAKVAYVPDSKQLVVEYDLPSMSIFSNVGSYKYDKAKDIITAVPPTEKQIKQRKALYALIVAQIALRVMNELFRNDQYGHIETIIFNGYTTAIDPATGRQVRPCLVTVRTTKDVFLELDLAKVDPASCLKALNASVSKSPTELTAVRPVLEFNMVDPRFIEETDVLSNLDQRSNLMELTPSEFESLITNLFTKMGLEARQTQASRDGGVDCVAYDPRPIFGGKVVIQAKRYKHTVGVSAVRDLFGTVQNEGASKGILVTTSGYGKASFEFANGKPLELLDGANLLHLLKEHAEIDAKIVPPDTWRDPVGDSPLNDE